MLHEYVNRKAASHFAPYLVTQFIIKTSSLIITTRLLGLPTLEKENKGR